MVRYHVLVQFTSQSTMRLSRIIALKWSVEIIAPERSHFENVISIFYLCHLKDVLRPLNKNDVFILDMWRNLSDNYCLGLYGLTRNAWKNSISKILANITSVFGSLVLVLLSSLSGSKIIYSTNAVWWRCICDIPIEWPMSPKN